MTALRLRHTRADLSRACLATTNFSGDRLIKNVPEVAGVYGKAGRAETATDPAPLEVFETTIQFKPRDQWRPGMTTDKLVEELDRRPLVLPLDHGPRAVTSPQLKQLRRERLETQMKACERAGPLRSVPLMYRRATDEPPCLPARRDRCAVEHCVAVRPHRSTRWWCRADGCTKSAC
jgi:hypothetical protein